MLVYYHARYPRFVVAKGRRIAVTDIVLHLFSLPLIAILLLAFFGR